MTRSVTQINYGWLLAKKVVFLFSSEMYSCYHFMTDDHAANVEAPAKHLKAANRGLSTLMLAVLCTLVRFIHPTRLLTWRLKCECNDPKTDVAWGVKRTLLRTILPPESLSPGRQQDTFPWPFSSSWDNRRNVQRAAVGKSPVLLCCFVLVAQRSSRRLVCSCVGLSTRAHRLTPLRPPPQPGATLVLTAEARKSLTTLKRAAPFFNVTL